MRASRDGVGRVVVLGLVVLGVAVLAILLGLWSQVQALNEKLASTSERAAEAERRSVELSEITQDAAKNAARAAGVAQQAEERRGQAEYERELAREQAELAVVESEVARADAARSRQEFERIRDARDQELDRMREALAKIAPTERTPLGMVMRLGEDSLKFDFDKAVIRDENKELLSRVAGVLLASHGYHIYIDGHTDDQGPDSYNDQLSQKRAGSVRRYLIEAGVPADSMQTRGYGEANPRVNGASDSARRSNRRVEIGIVDTVIEYRKAKEE